MLKNEVVQTMSLNIKFSYIAENSKFSRSNSYFSILTPTFLRDGFLNSCFQNPSENSDLLNVVVRKFFFLNSANQICQGTDISKYFIESLGIGENVSRLYLMTQSADPDKLASSEANWSGSTLFANTGHVVFSKRRVKKGLKGLKKLNVFH